MQTANTSLAPFNLITSWYWVHGEPERPVRIEDLQAVYLDGDDYQADVLAHSMPTVTVCWMKLELRLDSEEKTAFIRQKLEALGLAGPAISGRGAAVQHQPQCGVRRLGHPGMR